MDKPMAVSKPWRLTLPADSFKPPETPFEPMEFLSRSWSISALEVSIALAPSKVMLSNAMISGLGTGNATILEDLVGESPDDPTVPAVSGNPFSFASSETSQIIMECILSQSQDVSPRTSGRLSHSSGPLNGSLTDSPPVSPSKMDDIKVIFGYKVEEPMYPYIVSPLLIEEKEYLELSSKNKKEKP